MKTMKTRMRSIDLLSLRHAPTSSVFRSNYPGFQWGVGCGALSFELVNEPLPPPKELLTTVIGGELAVIIPSDTLMVYRDGVQDTGIEVFNAPVVEDIDLDGTLEILVPQGDGILLLKELSPVAKVEVERPLTPIVIDVNGDYEVELVIPHEGGIEAVKLDGTPVWSSPIRPIAPLAAVYLGHSSYGEVIVVAEDGVYALSVSDGKEVWSTPVRAKPIAPVVHDLNLDWSPEIIVVGEGSVYILGSEGQILDTMDYDAAGYPTSFDLDGDGVMEIVIPEREMVHVIPGWSFRLSDPTPAVIADVDGDGVSEVIVGCREGLAILKGEEGELYDELGSVATTPVLADLDGDGCSELVTLSSKGLWIGRKNAG